MCCRVAPDALWYSLVMRLVPDVAEALRGSVCESRSSRGLRISRRHSRSALFSSSALGRKPPPRCQTAVGPLPLVRSEFVKKGGGAIGVVGQSFEYDQNRSNQPDGLRSAELSNPNLLNVRICDKNSVAGNALIGDGVYFEFHIRCVVPSYLYFIAYFELTFDGLWLTCRQRTRRSAPCNKRKQNEAYNYLVGCTKDFSFSAYLSWTLLRR